MRLAVVCWILAGCCGVGVATRTRAAAPASEIVVAIRYLQAQGTSHSHLYLYREDGKLLRQLTNDNSGQERDPIFAPDGETIAFTREVGGADQFWSIEPRGGNLRRLPAAPDWYQAARSSPYFTNNPESEPAAEASPSPSSQKQAAAGDDDDSPPRYTAPDGSVELILEVSKEEEDYNGPGHGKNYRLRDLKTKRDVTLGKLPGFEGLAELLRLSTDGKQRFLLEPPLRVAFFDLHLDSTAGDTAFALDLKDRRIVRLSENWAAPIPLPGEPAFLTLTYHRYVPIPGSQKTANCKYMERWNAAWKKVRYAREGTAAICYGASIYRPGKTPAVITLRDSGD